MVAHRRFPSLSSIRAFEAAARLGSFAKAAQELGTTSASVSYHVRQLEQQVGVALFLRHAHRVELTAGGETIAREATSAFEALRASFSKAVELDQSRLSLTTLPTLGTSWLTPKLGQFRAQHPDIEIELDLSPDAQDLSTGHFDVAIRNGHGRWAGMRAVKLFPSIFMPLCVPSLKRAVAGLADPRRRLEAPLLGRPDWWALWYRARGVDEVPSRKRFGTHLSAEYLDVTAALAGHGVAIGSPILFRAEIESGKLVAAHDGVASDGRSFWFVCPAVRQQSPKIATFRDWLCSEASRACESAAGYIRRAVVVDPASVPGGQPIEARLARLSRTRELT